MSARRSVIWLVLAIGASMGASYPTTNFLVEAPTPQIAQQVGVYAEAYRKQKALEWLGHEMPPWPERCPIRVTVTMNGAGGATSFAFDRGNVLGQHMNIEGSLDRLLSSVLPHEVTHTVFAYYYRMPVPRWADEGGAVLSEDDIERNRHDMLCRQILNTPGRQIPLRRLFSLHDYPGDVMALYAEGFSIVNYLVSSSNKPTFLAFVAHGMTYGWDNAVQTYYHYQNIDDLEQAWKAYLIRTKKQPQLLAQNGAPSDPAGRMAARQTNPSLQPTLASAGPVYRGQSPGLEDAGRFGDSAGRLTGARPGYLPDSIPTVSAPPYPTPRPNYLPDQWQPATRPPASSGVILGPPQAAQPQTRYIPPAPAAQPQAGYNPPAPAPRPQAVYIPPPPAFAPPPGYVPPPGFPQ
jgi:hypothetical protein